VAPPDFGLAPAVRRGTNSVIYMWYKYYHRHWKLPMV